jgi:hypothetical protein
MKYAAIALGALVLGGCAETGTSISQPNTEEAAPASFVATVRLRAESPGDKTARAALATIGRLLGEENYRVVGPTEKEYDVDLVLTARSFEDGHTTITLASRSGRHLLPSVSADFVSNDGTVDDCSLVDAAMSWKRSYSRWTQAVRRHREMVAADQKADREGEASVAKPPVVGALVAHAAH